MSATEIWLVDLDRAAAGLEAVETAAPRLPHEMLRRLEAMSDDAARRERRLTHIALRILIEARLGPAAARTPFVRSQTGKPSPAAEGAGFSLAHTRGLALIAVGDATPLGVDIERTRPVTIPDPRRAPIEAEAMAIAGGQALAGPDRDARFLSAWVRIEAAAKALGCGVGPILERLRPGRSAPDRNAAKALQIRVHDIGIEAGVFAAVALEVGRKPPPLQRFPQTAAAIGALLGGGMERGVDRSR